MHLIITVDDNMGLMFNKRRQSRDNLLLQDLFELVGESALPTGGKLYVTPYSEKLLTEARKNLPPITAVEFSVWEDTLTLPGKGTYYFVEGEVPEGWALDTEKVILYRWNRVYPADTYFRWDLSANGFSVTETKEFTGSSHEKITREVWTR